MSRFVEFEINVVNAELNKLGVSQSGTDVKITIDLSRVESYRPTGFAEDLEMNRTRVMMHSGEDIILNIPYDEFDELINSYNALNLK